MNAERTIKMIIIISISINAKYFKLFHILYSPIPLCEIYLTIPLFDSIRSIIS